MSDLSQLINKLNEAAALCEHGGYGHRGRWFEERIAELKVADAVGVSKVLDEITSNLAGMGSFSDLPLGDDVRERQWDLVTEIDDAIAKVRTAQ